MAAESEPNTAQVKKSSWQTSLHLRSERWPWIAVAVVTLWTVLQLRLQGRRWWCACGQTALWWSDINSAHNSQHFADPYSFTHTLHGLALYGLIVWLLPRWSAGWRMWLAVTVEGLWEVIENTEFVIKRYREATLALGYEGDSIANCLGDVLFFVVGLALARRLGFWISAILFFLTELILLLWIKDSLLLNILMLLYPIEAIKTWQMG